MKKWICVVLILGLAVTGCAKKKEKVSTENKGRQFLVEGTVYLKQGDVVKAVESFASSIKVAPDFLEGYYMLGETFIRLKQFDQASAVMAEAVKRFPNKGLPYYLLAISEHEQGNTLAAIVAARRSVELFEAAKDEKAQQRAMILLAALVEQAKQAQEAQEAEVAQ